ncbi:MAG: tRNA dihydrouridine synthase DusB [Moraxellaceae bacterium]|nr:MAG: tRNA dihydrouridine synthase DusB [Moraxellaceae bacterium]
MKIREYELHSPVILAPMAGVTDQPFRNLCRRLGAGLVVSEMVSSDPRLWQSKKSCLRLNHDGEPEPRSVQIAGADPDMMAAAAQYNVINGAQIIDINMGCPAKKVCKKAAGSALLKDEKLVKQILTAVVNAVNVPVTLKIRTGWSPSNRNGTTIAQIAEDAGISALAVHGRTRECAYKATVEYDTIAAIKEIITIPVIANGDISSPQKAQEVLDHTAADAIMIGRGAQGNPWIFREIAHFLTTGKQLPPTSYEEVKQVMIEHLSNLHHFYGEHAGVRIARKHFGWYVQNLPISDTHRKYFNQLNTATDQIETAQSLFTRLIEGEELAA